MPCPPLLHAIVLILLVSWGSAVRVFCAGPPPSWVDTASGQPRRPAQRRKDPRDSRPLQILISPAYIGIVRARPDYGDKRLRNKRTGPGGGTRRLHRAASREKSEARIRISEGHSDFRLLISEFWRGAPRRGRNRIDRRVKAVLSLGMVSAVIGPIVQVPTITKWPSLPN
jgi:hypothetical protein